MPVRVLAVVLVCSWHLCGNSFGSAPVAAAERELEPMDLVAADVGVCLQLSNAGDRLASFRWSPLFDRLQSRTFYGDWLHSGHYQKLAQAKLHVERLADRPFEQFANDLFGRSVVLAIYPPDGDAEPIGVLLTQARDAQVLDAAIQTWDRAEPSKTVQLSHAQRTYFCRTPQRAGGKPPKDQFYVKIGPVLALSEGESHIRRVIELAGGSTAADETRLIHSAAYRRAADAAATDALAMIYVNPRSWDSQFEKQPAAAPLIAAMWHRLESVIVTLRLEPAVLVEAVLHYDGAATTDVWSRFVGSAQAKATLLDRIPDHSLAAISGTFPASLINEIAMRSFTGRQRDDWLKLRRVLRGLLLGRDAFDDVLSRFGAHWIGYVVPRNSLHSGKLPLEGLAAFELPLADANSDDEPSLRQSLDNAFNTGLNLLAAAHNAESSAADAAVRHRSDGEALVRWVDGLPSNQPAYALTPANLLLATSPETVDEFLLRRPAAAAASRSGFQAVRSACFPEANQILFINVAAVREFVDKNRVFFVTEAKSSESLSERDAQARIARFLDVAGLLDATFLAGRLGPERLRLVAGAAVNDGARDSSRGGE